MAPRFSVVIPTCRRTEALGRLLARLEPQRQEVSPGNYEVVVSDDDPEQSAARELKPQHPQVTFVRGPGRGPAANRNRGASHATGEWIVFTDDDCEPEDGWLRAIADAASAGPVDVIEGKIVAPTGQKSIFKRDVENLHGGVFWSANLAIRRDVFMALGGFDEDFGQAGGEDMELAHRFRVNGLRTLFCEEALVYHPSHVMTWRGVLELAFRLRWHTLYEIKTSPSMSIDVPVWRVLPRLVRSRTMDLLRATWQVASWRPASGSVSATALRWTLFPAVLPYLVYWHLRFRRLLAERRDRTPAADGAGQGGIRTDLPS